ncbi:hypothetical protein ACWGK5_32125 [Rhodococcus qingshengii]|uniref:Uncharacterized protein n=1 Tax=Rhodococcus erythropolis TaxID=1833 RepID=A0A8I0ZZT3_RHOER|nr:hypothetical protein [Rhodococcus erythropolis]EGR8595353.1 hypothetical protein [Listeria monocytogenes]EGR8666902.1 hypothetical protein [Listeria monocytogenes]EGS4806823.1 hypothetical protein [Listeria monocytogenes]EGS4817315.1 hypothetical protein [Listeria monocytogenes]MBH5146303.1 hypothetical protein [Rhodococcus erythropolis]
MTFTPKATKCMACGAAIFFCRTSNSERMPVEFEPNPNGNLAVTPKSDGLPEAVVIRPGQAAGMRAAGLPTYVSHFAACPMADEFRRKARHKSTVDTYRRNAAARSRARRA